MDPHLAHQLVDDGLLGRRDYMCAFNDGVWILDRRAGGDINVYFFYACSAILSHRMGDSPMDGKFGGGLMRNSYSFGSVRLRDSDRNSEFDCPIQEPSEVDFAEL